MFVSLAPPRSTKGDYNIPRPQAGFQGEYSDGWERGINRKEESGERTGGERRRENVLLLIHVQKT